MGFATNTETIRILQSEEFRRIDANAKGLEADYGKRNHGHPRPGAETARLRRRIAKNVYLANTVTPQDLTEIVTGLRQLFDLKRIQQLNARNAIVVRATPDVLTLVGKVIDDINTARPEVVIQVEVLEARTDRLRNLGILPGQTASIAINPNTSATSSTTTGTATQNSTLSTLTHLNSNDYQVTLPNFTANAILTDTSARII